MKNALITIIILLCAVIAQGQTYDATKPLLTEASQLTSNANSKACDSDESHLIDGNIETYYHSSWNTYGGSALPNAKHYLQWHLKEAVSAIVIKFTGMTWASAHNSPKNITIMATNTPSNASSWVKIIDLNNITPDDIPSHYTSPAIAFGQAYTDMRMVVNATTTGQIEATYGQQYFCLSEFQVYESLNASSAFGRLMDYVNTLGTMSFEGGTAPGYYEQSKADAFSSALSAARAATQDMSDEELDTLFNNLKQAYNEVKDALIPVTEGYYYIVCTDSRFRKTKALTTDWGMTLQWGNFSEDDPKNVFYIKPLESGNYSIQSFYSEGYVGSVSNTSTAFPMTETMTAEQCITFVSGKSYRFNCASYNVAYHMLDHSYGSGDSGNIIAWQNNAYDFSLFALQAVNSDKLEQLAKVRDDEIAAIDSASIGIVFIGNSITYGAGTNSPSTQAAPVVTGQLLAEKTGNFVIVKNCGLSGSTTVNWLPGTSLLNGAIKAGQALSRCTQLWFCIMLGTNDSAESGPTGSPVSTSSYRMNLIRIIDQITSACPKAKIVLNYPIWYSPNTQNAATYLEKGLKRLISYHPVITKLVKTLQESNKPVYAGDIKAYSYFENNNSMFMAENGGSGIFYLHPNTKGAAKLAEYWSNTILDIINDDPLAVDGVKADTPQTATPSKIYNLDGTPAAKPQPGSIYIQGNKKVIYSQN